MYNFYKYGWAKIPFTGLLGIKKKKFTIFKN